MQVSRLNPRIIMLSFFFVFFFGLCSKAEGQHQEPRGEIRVVDNWRLVVAGKKELTKNMIVFYTKPESRFHNSLDKVI